jgi:hypothetical protein
MSIALRRGSAFFRVLTPPTVRLGFDGLLLKDSAIIGLVALASAAYVGQLGFYSDDWSLLARFHLAANQSFWGFFDAVYTTMANVRMRPLQILYFTAMYDLFRLQPLGYHLVNSGVIALTAVALHVLLRQAGVPRLVSVPVALVYTTSPLYSATRFWFVAAGHNLSILLYLASALAHLQVSGALPRGAVLWGVAGSLLFVASVLTYEIALPLAIVNLWALLAATGPGIRARQAGRRRWTTVCTIAIFLVGCFSAIAFKLGTTTRLRVSENPISYYKGIVHTAVRWDYTPDFYGFNFKQALIDAFGGFGVGLPLLVNQIVREYPDVIASAAAVMTLVGTAAYLLVTRAHAVEEPASPLTWIGLLVCGGVVFVTGYAIFFMIPIVQFTLTGIGNRANVLAAIGAAMIMVAAVRLLTLQLRPRHVRPGAYALLIAFVCASGVLINTTLGRFWASSYRVQLAALSELRQQFPTLAPGTTVIVDGICPYLGPAIVFESSWDLDGALHIQYADPTLRADVVTPNMRIDADGLSTELYGALDSRYPYGPQLLVYSFRTKDTHVIGDEAAAREYFQTFNPDMDSDCPPGKAGLGTRIFRL